MNAIRPNKWILAVCGLAGIFSAIDVLVALKTDESRLAAPNSQVLISSSRVLLMITIICTYFPQRRAAAIAVAVGALSLAIWAAYVK